ncbi:DUF1963 domain-containing protein [Puerhibacterium sp. TATVAM-FAB25]|uniref:DUF1963 domain-containing protein n=1 Tax=Puerhibacterium sp. TATVAM-FAB25 TaxID=3093699 RepID=UPI00397DB255
MRDVPSPAWQRYLELAGRIAELTPRIHEVPVARWNALADEANAALAEVRADAKFLAELRDRVEDTTDEADRALLHEVLTGAVFELGGDVEALRADPRVSDVADELDIAPAIYLAEQGFEADPYEAEQVWPEDEEYRDLSRIGGVPTLTPDARPLPDDAVFLLQVDCSALTREAVHDEAVASVLRRYPLPKRGLLQVFHTTLGDSRTDPGRPGGGATVRYLAEADVRRRTAINPSASSYAASHASYRALATFRAAPHAGFAALDRVDQLQEEAYRVARNGSYTDEYLRDLDRDPFVARVGAVAHLFGLPSPDSDIADEDRALLSERLPLTVPEDEHLLLLEVAADHTFDLVFGDGGRLEIWIRSSDLAAARFDDVVSFIRSS